ncbi:MAG: hypothetical protein Q8P91_00030 [bacterium]|nr:hypothetical protein [bacterium]
MTTGTDEEIKLSEEKLQIFKKKSALMIPRKCFGGYCRDDPVCRDWCDRATHKRIEAKSCKIRVALNEHSSGLFCNDFGHSCEEERHRLEEQIREARDNLKRNDQGRGERDQYYLAEGTDSLKRIPVGEARWVKQLRDFTKDRFLYLETKDTRLFAYPYGPNYNLAEGRLCLVKATDTTIGYVKSITPKLPEASLYPFKVLRQEQRGEYIILSALLSFADGGRGFYDEHKLDGKEVILEVYGQSTKVTVQVDDIGII